MRGLPKSVREQGTMADQLHEQYYGQPPADDDDTRDPDTTGGDAGQPDGAPDDQPPADAATDTTREDNADYWQRRFNTLQGKYNAEVTQVAAENRQIKERAERAEDPPKSQHRSRLTLLNSWSAALRCIRAALETLRARPSAAAVACSTG